MTDFGSRLRSLRLERGLSQADLGATTYSASYISHLESGRRKPTREVLDFLASRFAMRADELESALGTVEPEAQHSAAMAALELRVQLAASARDYPEVLAASEAVPIPAAKEDSDVWWAVMWMKAQALLASESYEPCAQLAVDLAESSLALLSAELRAACYALASRALRAYGNLEQALERSNEAISSGFESGYLPQIAAARREQIATLAELGRLSEAVAAAQRLEGLQSQLGRTQLAGLVAWTLGNVAFLNGDPDKGVAEHARASGILSPDSDLRQWARFHKASAAMRMGAGITDGVDESLERAQHALALVGNASDLAELELLRAQRIVDDEPESALKLAEHGLAMTALPDQTMAEGHLLRARAFERLGSRSEVRTALMAAANYFDEAGADRKASALWRRLASDNSLME